uniref:CCHC-type domain-containing protein n=1 Tax=Xenopus tropicalis TaxID=8364 RepID=A0A803JV88_XENTR
MAAFYKRQTKETLINLCEQRGIDAADKSKEMLIRALVEQEQQNCTPESGDYATQDMPLMNSAPGSSQRGHSNSCSGQGDRNSYLQAALQLLGSDDPQLRLQPILQYQQAEAAAAAAEREAAAADKVAERQYQLELAKLQQQRLPPRSSESSELRPLITSADKFPVMDKDGDLDTFLRCFERACRQYHLPRLKGKALDAFVDLPPEFDGDYDAIKNALIKKSHLTPEVYRKKFRTVQRGPTDSYSDVVSSLRTTFKAWLRGLSVTTFDCLEDLMIKDQFLHTCPVEVRQFIMDREPKTADQAAEIARPTGETAHSNPKSGESSSFWGSVASVGQKETHTCFSCNQTGHVRADCPLKKEPPPPVQPVVMLVSGKMENLSHHMQPVTVGDKVTQGLRDSGSNLSLVRPEMINTGDIIPGKTLSIKGVGGSYPKVPVAKVFLDWGAGRGLREVGVTNEIPVNVLLGNDLGCMVTAFVPYDPVTLGPAVLECGHPPQQVIVKSKIQQSNWEGGLGHRSPCQPVPEPVVSQGGHQKGEGEEHFPLGVSIMQTGSVSAVRDCQRVISNPVSNLPEVLSGGQKVGQTQESVQESGKQVVRTQSRVLVDSAIQTGESSGSCGPGIAAVPEPVLRGGQVVSSKDELLTVPGVVPEADSNKTVQVFREEPNGLCQFRTEPVSEDQGSIEGVEGCQVVSISRPRKWGTRDRQKGPTGNPVGRTGQMPRESRMLPSIPTCIPSSGTNDKREVESVSSLLHSSACGYVGTDLKERDFRPGR